MPDWARVLTGGEMLRLTGMVFSVIGFTLAGVAVVIALMVGYATPLPLFLAAALGLTLALPASLAIARALS